MGVFVSDIVSARSSPYRPEPPGEGQYRLRGQILRGLLFIQSIYAMFIKQSPTRFTIVTNNDTKTRYKCVIYICGHLIQKCLLIA